MKNQYSVAGRTMLQMRHTTGICSVTDSIVFGSAKATINSTYIFLVSVILNFILSKCFIDVKNKPLLSIFAKSVIQTNIDILLKFPTVSYPKIRKYSIHAY